MDIMTLEYGKPHKLPWMAENQYGVLRKATPEEMKTIQVGRDILMQPNAPAHRRRADDVRLSTETQSRRSVQPVCSAICMSFSFQASHILPSAHGVSFGAPSLSSVGFLKLDAESERRGVTQFNPGTEVAMKPLSLHRSNFRKHP